MKSFYVLNKIIFCSYCLFFTNLNICAQAKNITFENIQSQCQGIKREDRVRITVARFSVSSRAAQATGQFGEELTSIITNALQQTNCFRVLESVKFDSDLESEIAKNETGATTSKGPQRGKQLSAQAIVTAEITEYNDGSTAVNIGPFSMGGNKAKLGVIVKVIDPETREILWSESINGEGKKSGFTGVSLVGFKFAGATKVSEAMSAAVEDLVLKTMDVLVKEKDQIIYALPNPNIGLSNAKIWNRNNCDLLKNGSTPKVMVIIPEYHIQMPIPDPAGETEILRKFLEAGYKAIDPSVYATIKNSTKFKEAAHDPMAAAAIGRDFGADIVIYGEAFSQTASRDNGRTTCRARVEAKAVRADNAEIIATNGTQAGGQDIAETTAAKSALRNAGSQLADYFLERLCESNEKFNNTIIVAKTAKIQPTNALSAPKTKTLVTKISLNNVSLTKFNNIVNQLSKKSTTVSITDKKLKGNAASFVITHSLSQKDLVVIMENFKTEIGIDYSFVN